MAAVTSPVTAPTSGPSTRSAPAGTCDTRAPDRPHSPYTTSAAPSACMAQAPAGAPSSQAPPSVPATTPACMGRWRRVIGASVGHGRICQTLVTSEGRISSAAACAGGMASASSAIASVGRPRPTTPLTSPASRKTVVVSSIRERLRWGRVVMVLAWWMAP